MERLIQEISTPKPKVVVIVPVRNEEERLPTCLRSLRAQSVPRESYEVIVLLNNCTDASPAIARAFRDADPQFSFHLVTRNLAKARANVGTVRKMLMDEASLRVCDSGAILSTDGDTSVAHDWIEANLKMLRAGSDAVGGDISLAPGDLARLPLRSRAQHEADREYQQAVTHLESLIDPDPHDPWPRHYHHFGASLACTKALYRQLGGLPEVDCLEDVEFVKAAIRADARVRHSPVVKVVTAARTSGRARVGLASQLREWQAAHDEPLVDSAPFLQSYFATRNKLRLFWNGDASNRQHGISAAAKLLGMTLPQLERVLETSSTFGAVHDALDLRGALWRAMPGGRRVVKRHVATQQILSAIAKLRALERPAGIAPHEIPRACSTPDGLENSHAPDRPWTDSQQLPA